jgi:hypothetical protein
MTQRPKHSSTRAHLAFSYFRSTWFEFEATTAQLNMWQHCPA